MAKKHRKPDAKPRGYSPSCANGRRWEKTVQRIVDGRKKESRETSPKPNGWELDTMTGLDNLMNPTKEFHMRRQESVITKFERTIPAESHGNFTTNKTIVTQGITEDFIGNSLDAFTKEFDLSNRLICSDLILALNPKKKHSSMYIASREKDYNESLEWYNICRNCKLPISAKQSSVNHPEVGAEKRALLDKIEVSRRDLANCNDKEMRVKLYGTLEKAEKELTDLLKDGFVYVAEIPAHHEVYFCEEKRGLKLREVARKVSFNQKCGCMFVEVRKAERSQKAIERKRIF